MFVVSQDVFLSLAPLIQGKNMPTIPSTPLFRESLSEIYRERPRGTTTCAVLQRNKPRTKFANLAMARSPPGPARGDLLVLPFWALRLGEGLKESSMQAKHRAWHGEEIGAIGGSAFSPSSFRSTPGGAWGTGQPVLGGFRSVSTRIVQR